jgi:hypothetical protein
MGFHGSSAAGSQSSGTRTTFAARRSLLRSGLVLFPRFTCIWSVACRFAGSVSLLVCLTVPVAPTAIAAQTATARTLTQGSLPAAKHRFTHHKKLQASYDSIGDSTHLTVVTHKGRYFLTIQRPRLTWTVVYAGKVPGPEAPLTVALEFRTQAPQVADDSRLVMASAGGEGLEVASGGAFSDPGVQTWSHYMRFPVPSAGLAAVLAGNEVTVTVGGITERFKPDQIEALRDLLDRVGAWPLAGAAQGGA